MNMDKTIMLLAGAHRGFSVAGGSEAASMLRDVGLSTAYDVTDGQVHNLPDKWHGVVLGDEAGAKQSWEQTIQEAVATAERLQASSLPTGSRGRLAKRPRASSWARPWQCSSSQCHTTCDTSTGS